MKRLFHGDPMEMKDSAGSHSERRKTLTLLQWLVVIGTSYLSLFSKQQIVNDLRVYTLIAGLLISVLVLRFIPDRVFGHRLFPHGLIVIDTIFISLGIGLNRETPWDLFLIYFFGLFIAAIGESMIQTVVACLIMSVIFVIISSFQGMDFRRLDSDLLLRIPFIFGVSILYGYLAEQVKSERKRVEKGEEVNRIKAQMVSALAHDIKNPLGVIVGYAETVASGLLGRPENEQKLAALQRIQDNAERIVKLVTGFLDASKVESGRVEMARQPVQLNALIREVCQQEMGDLRSKNLSLSVDLDNHLPEILADAGQIERVLWNLIGNAIKFTPMGGKISVASRGENSHVRVQVKDTGRGILKEELPLLFSEFRRLKGAGKIEGTGLGLFIVKTVVEAHGGKVGVESEEGHGATFSVTFPVAGRVSLSLASSEANGERD